MAVDLVLGGVVAAASAFLYGGRLTIAAVLLSILLVLTVIVVVLWIRANNRIFTSLRSAMGKIAGGEIGGRLPARTNDEQGRVIQAFNEMSVNLDWMVSRLSVDRSRLQTILSTMTDGVILTDRDGKVVLANPAAERILACAAGGLAGLDWRQALGVDRIESAERRDALLKGQEAELVAVNRNGEECPLAVTFAPIEQPHGRARFNIVLFRDLRDQRAGERTMRDAERLHAIVDLSSTIAHEIRNPLASMSGSAELLQDKVVDEDSKHLAGIIVREVERLDAIVEDFLSFTRLRTMEIGSVDVNELMMDVVVMLYRSGKFNPNIKLVCRELPEPLVIKGDGKQLRQALLNIGMNALDAMPDGGELEVAATRATRDGMVEVFIRDTGRGMPAAIQSRVFQPFFSTKDHGSGIGLFVAQNVIQGHRGEISFETADGAGTTFHILLPVT